MIQNPKVGDSEWVISQMNLIRLSPDSFKIVRLKIESIDMRSDNTSICHMKGGRSVIQSQLFRTQREAKQHVVDYIDNEIDSLEHLRRRIWR